MQRHIRIEPATHAALRTLLGRALERVFVTGNLHVVRRLRDEARTLEVRSRDGRKYSGVLVVHGNEVASGLVVETPVSELEVTPSPAAEDNRDADVVDRFANQIYEWSREPKEQPDVEAVTVAAPEFTANLAEVAE